MRKLLCFIGALLLALCLTVPAFAYSTAVIYNAEREPPHTITLDPNGGTLPKGQETLTLERDGYVSVLPIPTRAGYTFAGWFVDSACATLFTDTTLVDRNLTLYAGWDIVSGGHVHRPARPGGTNGITDTNGTTGNTNGGGQSVGSPETGDVGIAAYTVMALSAIGGSAWTLAVRRREQQKQQ